jgi:hypothetical protein
MTQAPTPTLGKSDRIQKTVGFKLLCFDSNQHWNGGIAVFFIG